MAAVADDLLSEQCIAQVLENDLRLLESLKQAEKLQLDHVVAVSARGGLIPKFSQPLLPESESDVDLAFKFYVSDALANNDADYAQSIQNEIQATIIQDWQYAQKVAAAERSVLVYVSHLYHCGSPAPPRKINLDAEFARKLQAFDDEGKDIDGVEDAGRYEFVNLSSLGTAIVTLL